MIMHCDEWTNQQMFCHGFSQEQLLQFSVQLRFAKVALVVAIFVNDEVQKLQNVIHTSTVGFFDLG